MTAEPNGECTLAALERLIGTWQLESTVEGRSMARGSTTFGWIEDGVFLLQHADARGVYRIYQMRLTDEEWTVWRDAPGFFQRFIGSFGDGGKTITGCWESSRDGSAWEPDFDMRYWR